MTSLLAFIARLLPGYTYRRTIARRLSPYRTILADQRDAIDEVERRLIEGDGPEPMGILSWEATQKKRRHG